MIRRARQVDWFGSHTSQSVKCTEWEVAQLSIQHFSHSSLSRHTDHLWTTPDNWIVNKTAENDIFGAFDHQRCFIKYRAFVVLDCLKRQSINLNLNKTQDLETFGGRVCSSIAVFSSTFSFLSLQPELAWLWDFPEAQNRKELRAVWCWSEMQN